MNQNAYLNYWKKQNEEQTQKRIKEKQKAWKNLKIITKMLNGKTIKRIFRIPSYY